MVTLLDQRPERIEAADGPPLIDQHGRHVTYVRLSVTDRCDLRCTYCMAEKMTFLPKRELLTLEELEALALTFIGRGVERLRITGGEPLVRKDILTLIERLGARLGEGGFKELTLTTNGTQLEKHAARLAAAGVRRINLSLDTLDTEKYSRITRGGDIEKVLAGINAAQREGIAIKLNAVALRHDNVDELRGMIEWAHGRDMDMTLIEAMPMGEIDEDRTDQYISLQDVRRDYLEDMSLEPLAYKTGGPARYFRVAETGGRLGLITPLSHNFCESCNRVRVTCTGRLYMCLGQESSVDLRDILRSADDLPTELNAALDRAMGLKPKGHDFVIDRAHRDPSVSRHMSVTGG